MTKTYCNKCGTELTSGNYRPVRMSISPLACHGEIRLDFCENCLKEILGNEEYRNLIDRETAYKQRFEERRKKKEREVD